MPLKLKKQFAESRAPSPAEIHGYYAVRLVTGFLPDLRFFGHRKFFPIDAADQEPGSGGFNEFLGRIRVGSFAVKSKASILGDGQQVLCIDYNRPGNPFWLRILNDELKKIDADRYLGRGILTVFGLSFNSFYFSVEREPAGKAGKKETGPRTGAEAANTEQSTPSRSARAVIRGRGEIVFNRVADVMIPRGGAFEAGAADYDLVPRVNAYLNTLTPALRRLTPFMLWYVELISMLFNGRRFSRISGGRAERFLERMEHGRLIFHRHIILFFKLLVMTAFYEQKMPAESIGYVHGCHLQAGEETVL